MARLSNSDSRRMYSWWWDSHISPKNSKWLQENLTDMDAKVKVMIKLIEEDADSFARRAEMYYKKRPELMKLVEEFYRAYRALAERYDHATGVIRHAHHTMSEAFPNQVPSFPDDSPSNQVSGTDPGTPDTSILNKEFIEESGFVARSQAFNKKVRKSLNFDKAEEKGPSTLCNENNHVKDKTLLESDHVSDSEEILISKEALSKLEAEKEACLVQYQKSLDKLSQFELEISQTQEELKVLSDHATKAENEVVVLKEYLSKLETEKESKLQDYQQYLEKISNLQSTVAIYKENAKKLDEAAVNAEIEAQTLKDELAKLAVEKDAALSQYMGSLDMISNLENKLKLAEEDALRLKERAEIAESEVESLKQTISNLERSNQSLRSELESLMSKMGTQTRELTEKQKELGKFWACMQEERLHFVEAETDFQTLLHLHAQTQEDLRSMASELHDKAELLKVVETRNHSLLDEVLKVKEENKHLDELNALSIKGMQNEISNLRESKGKLLEEVEPILEERDTLQQELCILKEELNNLQEENSNLKETFRGENIDKAAHLEKRELLGQLLEKNSILEKSLSKANDELQAVRGKIEALEKSFESLLKEKCALLDEKDTLMIQLKETNKNLEKLSQNNTILVSSLSGVRRQVEILKAKSKILEDSCQLLVNEKEDLISEKDGLTSLLDNTRRRLEDLVKIFGKLQGRCITLEKEKESTLRKVEELQMSLDVQRQGFSSCIGMNKTRFTSIEAEMKVLHQECQGRKRELDQVIDNAVENKIEIFVLRITAQELAGNNCSFLVENEKLLEKLSLSEKTIAQLQKANCEQEVEIKSLSDQLEFKVRTDQLVASQSEVLILLDKNEELKSKLRKEECNREALVAQVEDLNRKLADIQTTSEVLQRENSETSAEKRFLMGNFQHLEENNNFLEEENYVLCCKVLALENFSFILGSCIDEKLKVLREYGDNLTTLDDMSAALMEKLNLAEGKLEKSHTENLHLQENLQKSEDELKNVASIKDQLSTEIENGKKMLHQLKLELQQGQEKLSIAEKENIELNKSLEGLRVQYTEVKMVQDSQENQIDKMSADNANLIRENNCLRGASQAMEDELHKFHEEHNERKIREDNLQLELQSKINLINKLETETVDQFQCSMVSQLLYERKFRELREACFGYLDQIENLKNQLAAYGPEIVCLKECVSSLENHTGVHIKFQNPENDAVQGAHVTKEPHGIILNEDKKEIMPSSFSDLHDLRYRLQAIEKAAVEIRELTVQENIDLHSKLDTAMKNLELLKHGSGRYRRNSKPTSEITEAYNTVLTKDIVLDQVSDGSYNGFSKREPVDTDNQIVEFWETADPNGTIGLTVGKSKKTVSPSKSNNTDLHRVKSVRKQKGKFHISDALVEKELSIDKPEIYRRSTTPHQEGNRRKILERLDSDVQKLANLQITVQDLKRKLAVTEKGRRGKAVLECEALKLQLEEADMAIMKLFDLNGRLMKSMEEGSSFTEIKSSFDMENDGSARRRRVSDQARRMSEKIGMLQLEVQKFQFVLLKMDNEKGVKVNMPETRRRILLRDFIYGGGRTGQRRKKAQCCVCVQPSTSDD